MKRHFRTGSWVLIASATFIAAAILFGWIADLDSIKYSISNSSVMNPVSAVCFLILGVSFYLIHSDKRQKSLILFSIPLIPVIVGVLRLLDFSWGSTVGIDGVLFPDEIQNELPGILSNRMAPNTALNFQLVGIAILLSGFNSIASKRIANYFSVAAILVSLFALIGYLYQVKELTGYLTYVPMSFQSAMAFLLMALSILFINNDYGFMSVVTSPYSGGTLARILIPAAVIAPIALGWIRLNSQRETPIPSELGTAFLITFIVLLFFLLILVVSFVINKKDTERQFAEDALNAINQRLEEKVEERTQEVLSGEKRFRLLIENSSEGLTLLDSNFQTVYQSPAFESITGYTTEERKALGQSALIYSDDLPEAHRAFGLVIRFPDLHHKFTYRIRHKDGRIIWIEGSAFNLLSDKDINAIVLNYRDITERKNAETKLEASAERLRAILESGADAYVVTDENFLATYQSPAAQRITGISLEYRRDHPGQQYAHPDDIPYLQNLLTEVKQHPGKPLPFQLRFVHLDGHFIWIEGVVTNLLQDSNVKGITFHYRDITDRKRFEQQQAVNEQRFRALIENISDAIVLNDQHSNIIYQSPSVERILGYNPAERAGKKVLDYVHPDYRDTFIELYKNLELFPGKPLGFEYKFLHKEGHFIWLEGVVTNLLHDPNVGAYVANYRDVSERKASEERLSNLNAELEDRVELRTKQLQAANHEMEAFTYSVSHDLRAPLRIINGFSQIIKEDYAEKIDADGQKILDRIMSNSRRMGRLIDDLLDFSRMGRSEINMSRIDMNKLVQETLEELVSSGVSIPNEFVIEDLPSAKGDHGLIKQVWSNLLANAIKYSAKKEFPRIEVCVKTEHGKIIYMVRDNGDGFDMAYYSKLFGVFQRLHKESEFTGTGVGLALVQRIILRHGGRIWAEGMPGEGAVFYFYLPTE